MYKILEKYLKNTKPTNFVKSILIVFIHLKFERFNICSIHDLFSC